MDITSLNNNAQTTQGTGGASNTTLGKDQFLQLFTTQLKYQDPLNPMDSTQFTAQLAQFSSLEQLTNISQQMSNMSLSQNYTLSANLIGKNVTVSGNSVSLKGTASISYTLAQDASTVKASLYDASGKLIRQMDLGQQKAGNESFVWNGKDSSGKALPDGQYTFQIDASDASGNSVSSTTLTNGTVTGIAYDSNATYLVIDGKTRVLLTDVKQINSGGA